MNKCYARIPIAPFNAHSPLLDDGRPNPGYRRFGLLPSITDPQSYEDNAWEFWERFVAEAEAEGVVLGRLPVLPFGRSPERVPWKRGITGFRLDQINQLTADFRWLLPAAAQTFLDGRAPTILFLGGHPSMTLSEARLSRVADMVPCIFDALGSQPSASPLTREVLKGYPKPGEILAGTHPVIQHYAEANSTENSDLDRVKRFAFWTLWPEQGDPIGDMGPETEGIPRMGMADAPLGSIIDFRHGIETKAQWAAFDNAILHGLEICTNMRKISDLSRFFGTIASSKQGK